MCAEGEQRSKRLGRTLRGLHPPSNNHDQDELSKNPRSTFLALLTLTHVTIYRGTTLMKAIDPNNLNG